jgi:hypothetical protein
LPKYDSISTILAKVFFSILETKNFQLLKPKPKEKDLDKVFVSIYDDFFLKSDNPEANEYLKVTKEIAFLNYKIAYLKQSLYFYYYNKTTEKMRMDFIDALKEGYDIIIDKSVPFAQEVLRVLNVEIGIIQNDLTIYEVQLKEMTSKSKQKAFDYEEQIVGLEKVIGRGIKDGIMLDKYIAYGKQAKQTMDVQSKNKKVA